ncbi:MAG: hypothetical protein LDLANPLL_00991 [Turneriella sp.]|nr:hypothetical protein [Turneriella sp.]
MDTALKENFLDALEKIKFPTLENFIPLVPEASSRRYFRLYLKDKTSIIGVYELPESAKNTMPMVLNVQDFLKKRKIAVPEIYFTGIANGIMLQEDLGDISLNTCVSQNPNAIAPLYLKAIENMYSYQSLKEDKNCVAFTREFDVPKFMFELDFFIEHALEKYFAINLSNTDKERLRKDFLCIAEFLAAPLKKFFTHRDYHSRNIFIKNTVEKKCTEGNFSIIDFQDARLGLVQYDLASLLFDAYTPIDSDTHAKLLEEAFVLGKKIHNQVRDEFYLYFYRSAYQRIVKAIGTFGYQASLGRKDFAGYIAPAIAMLEKVIAIDPNLPNLTKYFVEVQKA